MPETFEFIDDLSPLTEDVASIAAKTGISKSKITAALREILNNPTKRTNKKLAGVTSVQKIQRGRYLRIARRRSHISAQTLVDRLYLETDGRIQLTTSAVYAWENGRNLLHDELIPFVARALRCKLEELLGEPTVVYSNTVKRGLPNNPTMDEIRESGTRAFKGMIGLSTIDMEQMLWRAENWPPE